VRLLFALRRFFAFRSGFIRTALARNLADNRLVQATLGQQMPALTVNLFQ